MTLIDRHRASVLFIDMQERLVPEVEFGNLVASMCERLMAWLGDQQAGCGGHRTLCRQTRQHRF